MIFLLTFEIQASSRSVFGAVRISRNDLSCPCRFSLGGKKGPVKPLISISAAVQQETCKAGHSWTIWHHCCLGIILDVSGHLWTYSLTCLAVPNLHLSDSSFYWQAMTALALISFQTSFETGCLAGQFIILWIDQEDEYQCTRCRWTAKVLRAALGESVGCICQFCAQTLPCMCKLVGKLFPTCQVRVVRFYQSCSSPSPPPPPPRAPPSPPPVPPLPCSLPPCQLFAKLFANFRTQWALLDLNCKGLSALGTAGPQPGTFRAQWAPLDLNLGPSELSEHRWTSTWDPSSVSTAGPQPGTLRAQWAPLALNGQIECQKICQIERQMECQKECQKICQIKCQNVCQIEARRYAR